MLAPCPIPLLLSRDAPTTLRRLDRDGGVHRIRSGVYAPRGQWLALTPWDRYLVRVHAIARTWTAPVFCLESAAALQGLPVFGEPREIHVLAHGSSSWRKGDVVVHAFRDDRTVASADGYFATLPFETAVDLCRVLPPALALAVADAALRRGLSGREGSDFHAHGAGQANRRGLRRLQWVQSRAQRAAESTGESLTRAAIEWLGYDAPELQVEFPHPRGVDRPDFLWRDAGVIGEFDGYGKYRRATVEETTRVIADEKRRENRLRAQVTSLTRWGWADVIAAGPLDLALRGAGLRPSRPTNSALLATLASNPRSFPSATGDPS